jgi:uncharacterized protein (DUF697 family)
MKSLKNEGIACVILLQILIFYDCKALVDLDISMMLKFMSIYGLDLTALQFFLIVNDGIEII